MISENNDGLAGPSPASPVPVEPSLLRAEREPMNGQMLRQTVPITNRQGFHLRPVTAFAQLAARFDCSVQVSREGRTANGKSAWDLMSVLAPSGSELTVEVEGPDAAAALEALVNLLANLPDAEEDSSASPLSQKG